MPKEVRLEPRSCTICGHEAVAEFLVGEKSAPQCLVHGYIVMTELQGATTAIYDHTGFHSLVNALEADGYEVLVGSLTAFEQQQQKRKN